MKNANYINRLIHSNNLLLYLIITFIFVIITGKLWWEFKDISAAIGCSIIIPFGVMILKEVMLIKVVSLRERRLRMRHIYV